MFQLDVSSEQVGIGKGFPARSPVALFGIFGFGILSGITGGVPGNERFDGER